MLRMHKDGNEQTGWLNAGMTPQPGWWELLLLW
jgi:hypothetical protein